MAQGRAEYSDFLAHCDHVPVLWRGRDLSRLPQGYRCSFCSEDVVADLVSRHRDADLVKSGIAVRSEDGHLRLRSQLDGRGQVVIALCDSEGEHPFEIIGDDGCVSQRRLPACAVLNDTHTKETLEKFDDTLLVTSSMEEVVILRRCGIPAVVSIGLEGLHGRLLSEFTRDFRLGPRHPKTPLWRWLPASRLGTKVVLVGASLVTLDLGLPERLRPVEEYLRQFLRSFDLDSSNVKVWRPGPDLFEKLSFVVSHGRTRDIRSLLLSSVREESQCLVSPPPRPKTGMGLCEALANWSIATGRPNDRDLREQAWEVLIRAWDEELIWPLMMAAESCHDPVAANQQIMLAELMRMVHPLAAKLSEEFRDRRPRGDGFYVPPKEEPDLSRLIQAVKLSIQISRELYTWKEKGSLPSLPFPRRSQSPC